MKLPIEKSLYIILLLFLYCGFAGAQTDSINLKLAEKPQKKYNLTFRLDYALNDLNFKNTFQYEGEYYKNESEGYIWRSIDSTLININDISRSANFKLDLMISVIEPLNIGLSYHLLNKQVRREVIGANNNTYTTTDFYPFFALAGMVDYKIAIKPIKRLYLNPSVSFGTYQGNKLFTGVGKEWYADIKLAILYNIGNHFGLRVYGDYSNWFYREKGASTPFPDKNRIVKSNVSSIDFGVGLSYRFFLVPD